LVSTKSKGLFHKAIIQSDPFTLDIKDITIATKLGNKFLEAIGCTKNNITCLRSKTVDQVLDAQEQSQGWVPISDPLSSFLPWTPLIDGEDIKMHLLEAFNSGNFNRVPIILGHVNDEALMFIYEAWSKNLPAHEYEAIFIVLFGNHFRKLLGLYPANKDIDNRGMLSIAGTDYIFLCVDRLLSKILSNYVPVWRYHFNHSLSFTQSWGENYTFCQIPNIVCHGSELPFVFNSAQISGYKFTAEEAQLSNRITNYWANFAYSSDPNKGVSVGTVWPQYKPSTDQILNFLISGDKVLVGLKKEYCDVWDTVGY